MKAHTVDAPVVNMASNASFSYKGNETTVHNAPQNVYNSGKFAGGHFAGDFNNYDNGKG